MATDQMTPPELEFNPQEIDKIICDFSMSRGHAFSEKDLEFMVLSFMNQINRILAEKIAKCPVVYGKQDQRRWIVDSQPECDDTCTAHLVGIKEIEK